MKLIEILKLIVAIVVSELAGVVGVYFTASSVQTWYSDLKKPSFNPPSWLFGPVWTALYALMGVAAYMVWRKGLGNKNVRDALAVFLLQLTLNVSWSLAFFGLRSPLAGLAVIIALWLAIVITLILFYRVSPPAAWLLIPYLLWVSYATLLNLKIWRLNP